MLKRLTSRYKIVKVTHPDGSRPDRYVLYERDFFALCLTVFCSVITGGLYLAFMVFSEDLRPVLWGYISVSDTYEEAFASKLKHQERFGPSESTTRYLN